jgi:hypothetical protein
MPMMQINGVNIVSPKALSVTINDVDSDKTTRTAKGDLVRDRIAVKRTLSLQFPPLTNSQISTLLNSMSSTFFTCNYPDPMVGGLTTKTFYVGNRTAPMFNYTTNLWESVSMDFIEK